MDLPPEFLFVAAIAAAAFLSLVLWARGRRRRTRSVGRMADRGPADLRYVCASCSGRFTHSRRTRLAWEKGARSFYCNACHTRTLGVKPVLKSQMVPKRKARLGCLPVVALMVVVPAVVGVLHRLA